MKTLKTEITINASISKVWNILMNHENYADWNPFVKSISGGVQPGNRLAVTLQPEGGNPMNFTPLVIKNEKEKEFRWLGKLFIKGLFDGEHFFYLERIDEHTTLFIHGENFRGILVGVLMGMIGENTLKGFEAMNVALKQRAEAA